MRELAASGVNFEAKLVKTHTEYVSALVKARFALIVADQRAETSGVEDLSLFEIAEELAPGTPFVLLYDPLAPAPPILENAVNFSTLSLRDLHLLQSVMHRAVKSA
jgi:hypothetical protein